MNGILRAKPASRRPILKRLALLFFCALFVSLLAGCSTVEELKKQGDVASTLSEADRQFTIGNTTLGEQWCDKAVAIDPDSPETYLGGGSDGPIQSPGLVALLQEHGQYPDIVRYLTQATANPKLTKNWVLYMDLADAQEHMGDTAGEQAADRAELAAIAKQFTTAGAPINTGNGALLETSKADAEWGSGDQTSALKDYHEAIVTYPDHKAEVENDEAYFEAVSKVRLSEALTLATDAVDTARHDTDDETLGNYIDTLGWVEHQMGNDRDAVNDLEQATSLVPEEGDIAFHLASVYQSLDRMQDAIIEFHRTLVLQPYNKDAQQALAILTKAPPAVAAKPV